jgi:hypothetical protein
MKADINNPGDMLSHSCFMYDFNDEIICLKMAGIVFVHNKYGYQDHGFKNDP